MHTATATLRGITPYSQSRPHCTPKLPKESAADHEERTWRERLHVDEDGRVFIPPMAFKNCLAEAAKYVSRVIPGKGKATYTKHFEAGVMVVNPLVLDLLAADVTGERLFVPADGRRGSGKRVWKVFPIIHEWAGEVEFLILDDTVTRDVFEDALRDAGSFIGIGRFRPRNNGFYGRFEVEALDWR